MNIKPVALPPGRARLETNPCATGSMTLTNTIGTVWVTCCKAPITGLAEARITSGLSATNSAAYLRILAVCANVAATARPWSAKHCCDESQRHPPTIAGLWWLVIKHISVEADDARLLPFACTLPRSPTTRHVGRRPLRRWCRHRNNSAALARATPPVRRMAKGSVASIDGTPNSPATASRFSPCERWRGFFGYFRTGPLKSLPVHQQEKSGPTRPRRAQPSPLACGARGLS
jgi:uncharacterized protein (DUF2237 family)